MQGQRAEVHNALSWPGRAVQRTASLPLARSRPKDGVASARLWTRPSTSFSQAITEDVDARVVCAKTRFALLPRHDEYGELSSIHKPAVDRRQELVVEDVGGV